MTQDRATALLAEQRNSNRSRDDARIIAPGKPTASSGDNRSSGNENRGTAGETAPNPRATLATLKRDARPYAEAELAREKAGGRRFLNAADERAEIDRWIGCYVSTAIARRETVEQVAARHRVIVLCERSRAHDDDALDAVREMAGE